MLVDLGGQVGAENRAEIGLTGVARRGEASWRGVAWRGVARRAAAAARDLLLLPGEAWRARRVVMTPHAEKLLVTHRGGSEPEQATCRMTVGDGVLGPRRKIP